jgi:hypothetical protein
VVYILDYSNDIEIKITKVEKDVEQKGLRVALYKQLSNNVMNIKEGPIIIFYEFKLLKKNIKI